MTWRATSARLVIRRYVNPRFMSHMACYDVEYSSNIWQALRGGRRGGRVRGRRGARRGRD